MKKFGLVLGLVAVVLVGGVMATAVRNDHRPDHPTGSVAASASGGGAAQHVPQGPGESILPVRRTGEPCDREHPAALSLKDLVTNVPIWVPEGERLTRAFMCGPTPILFYNGVEVSFEDGYSKMDPATKFPTMVASDGGRVQTINGRLAYVREADMKGTRNAVWILAGDISVGLTAEPDVSIDRVLQIASEIHIPVSVGN